MYHRDHDASPASPGPPADGGGPLDGQPDAVGLPRLHDCLWTEVADTDRGFLMLLNGDHVCVYASPEISRTFGCSPRSLVGTRPETFLEPDQLPQIWRARAAVAAGAADVLIRLRWRDDGQERWFDITSGLVTDPFSGVRYTAVRGRDVSHEMELQAALTRSEQRHSSLLSVVDQAVLQLDADLRIESFNPQALRLLGRAPDELLGRSAWVALDLRDGDGRPVADVAHPALAATGAGREEPWCTVTAADRRRTLVRVRLTSFAGPRPESGGHLLIFREANGGAGAHSLAPSREQARAAAGLTAREGDVLDGLAAGGDVPTISRRLGISVHSVRGHVKSITAKLGVHSQLQAVIAAARRGMVDLADEPTAPTEPVD